MSAEARRKKGGGWVLKKLADLGGEGGGWGDRAINPKT